MRQPRLTVISIVCSAVVAACGGGGTPEGDFDASTDLDADADTDTDSDADTDSDVDAGEDAGGDAGVPMTPGDYGDPTQLVWAQIDGGTFLQGSESTVGPAVYAETPAHEVTVPTFEMMKTEVTTSQYAQCVLAEVCEEPVVAYGDGNAQNCNWLWWGREHHPVNCLYVYEASVYCAWLGARLPSESEWEYAARSRGQDNEYPWGDAEPSCDLAIINAGNYQYGCGLGHTWPVCSKTTGNTEQGLCDMAGNVKEWLPDCWHGSYYGAPTDGSVWAAGPCEDNVLRGGGYKHSMEGLRTRLRSYNPSIGCSDAFGFRCARSLE